MSKEQIEEMARVIKSSLDGLGSGNFNFTGYEISIMFAKALCNAGYGKQSEVELSKRNRSEDERRCKMKTIELTDSQVESLKEFFEFEFIPSIRDNTDIDNINYLVDMCDIYKKLNGEGKEGAK